MTTFVDAIRKKYEKLTECICFQNFSQKTSNRTGANILFPARTLTMDGQQISCIGSETELIKAAGHVSELDLAGNRLSSWNEVFILLRCLRHLESLNLSQNPLGPNCSSNELTEDMASATTATVDQGCKYNEVKSTVDSVDSSDRSFDHHAFDEPCSVIENQIAANGATSPSNLDKDLSPILRFASYEPVPETYKSIHSVDSFQMNTFPDNTELENWENWSNGDAQPTDHSETLPNSTTKTPCPPIQLAVQANLLGPNTVFPRLSVLALNATYVPWNWVLELLPRLPNLSTLHVALNNYGSEEDRLEGSGDSFDWHTHSPVFPHLRTLYYSDNGISSWWTVCRLGRIFPGLEQLVLLGNPLSHIPAPLPTKEMVKPVEETNCSPTSNRNSIKPTPLSGKVSCTQPITTTTCGSHTGIRSNRLFACLHTLGLSETMLSRWESVDALGEWMPNMTNLRLGNTLPVFQSWPESECRAHVIARLPNLKTYNRSAIDSEERESAEREFVRHYGQIEPSLRPNRYWELERQHGRLEPLANIDLSPKRFVRVRVALGEKEIWHNLNLNLKVSQVKRQFANLLGIEPTEMKRFRLLYYDQVMALAQGPEELKFPNRAIHSYQPESGDLFEFIRFPDFSRSG